MGPEDEGPRPRVTDAVRTGHLGKRLTVEGAERAKHRRVSRDIGVRRHERAEIECAIGRSLLDRHWQNVRETRSRVVATGKRVRPSHHDETTSVLDVTCEGR